MMDPGTIIRSIRNVVRPLRKLMTEKKNSLNDIFDIDCQLKSIPIQLLILANMLIDDPACTTLVKPFYQLPKSFFQTGTWL